MTTTTYKAYVRHYGEQTQVMDTFPRRHLAERFMCQQAEIVKGYEKRTGFVNDQFVVFGEDDTYKTTMWVGK